MAPTPVLDSYRFHEQGWERFDRLAAEFDWEVPDRFNIASYVCDRWATAADERVALYAADAGTEYTFTDLRRLADRLANWLTARGVTAGDRICVSGSQTVETIAAQLAAWKLGAMSVPLSVLLGPDGLGYRLEDAGAEAFVVDRTALDAFREAGVSPSTVLVVGDATLQGEELAFHSAVDGAAEEYETAATAAEDPAAIIYTSGTTGDPKGVVHSHSTLLGTLPCVNLGALNTTVADADVGRTVVEWSWAGALFDFVLPFWYYGIPVVARHHREFDPAAELDLIDRYGITVLNAPPTALRMVMQLDEPGAGRDLTSLRVLFSGGESVGDTIVEWAAEVFPNAVVHEGYGQTEAPAFVGDCTALGRPHRAGKMGVASPGSEVRLVDRADPSTPVGDGEVGEIALRAADNPGVFTEYWNKPEKTAAKFHDGWLLSEDLGEADADGYVTFHSRKDDVIISAGYRIGPEEIEETLTRHDAVADAGVIGVPDDTRGEIPKAFVVLSEGAEPSDRLREDLASFVRERLAKYEYPRELAFLDELPTTTTGKVRRVDLRARDGLD